MNRRWDFLFAPGSKYRTFLLVQFLKVHIARQLLFHLNRFDLWVESRRVSIEWFFSKFSKQPRFISKKWSALLPQRTVYINIVCQFSSNVSISLPKNIKYYYCRTEVVVDDIKSLMLIHYHWRMFDFLAFVCASDGAFFSNCNKVSSNWCALLWKV